MARSIEDFYSIENEIGYGEFSVVHEGFHKETKKPCAIKIIDKNSLSDPQKERVDVEVDILKNCDHPYIVKIFDAFENPQRYYVVMELMRGGDLFEKLMQVSRYSEEQAKITTHRILKAVQYLHSKGIAHRDLKPENMLVDQDDFTIVKLSDFGLAKRASEDDPLSTPCGTISYAAPEVTSEGSYRMEVDMWSVGVICFTLLSGVPPFCSEDEDELLEMIANAEFSFSSPIWNEISHDAKDLIRKLLERDVNVRLTASRALRHPWFSSLSFSPSSSLSASDEGMNSSFSSAPPPDPKTVAVDLEQVNISRQLSKERLRQINVAIDSQRDGIVSLKPASESSIAKRRQKKKQNQD